MCSLVPGPINCAQRKRRRLRSRQKEHPPHHHRSQQHLAGMSVDGVILLAICGVYSGISGHPEENFEK